MGDKSFVFCYWDDIGDSQDHVDNQKVNHFDYFNNHAAAAKIRENGMGILHEPQQEKED